MFPVTLQKNTPSNKRAIMAEFIATALFVYVGCGAAVASQTMLGLDGSDSRSNSFLVVVALAFGLGISVLAYGIAPVSGGHINPAVTFALMVLGQMRIVLGMLYVAAQLVGAVLGAALVYGTFAAQELKLISGEETPPFLLGMNSVAPAISYGSAFLGEAMGTFLLVFTVLMTAVYKHVSRLAAPSLELDVCCYIIHLSNSFFRTLLPTLPLLQLAGPSSSPTPF
jgi:glycerol uptake facilitator-like aquaporin